VLAERSLGRTRGARQERSARGIDRNRKHGRDSRATPVARHILPPATFPRLHLYLARITGLIITSDIARARARRRQIRRSFVYAARAAKTGESLSSARRFKEKKKKNPSLSLSHTLNPTLSLPLSRTLRTLIRSALRFTLIEHYPLGFCARRL